MPSQNKRGRSVEDDEHEYNEECNKRQRQHDQQQQEQSDIEYEDDDAKIYSGSLTLVVFPVPKCDWRDPSFNRHKEGRKKTSSSSSTTKLPKCLYVDLDKEAFMHHPDSQQQPPTKFMNFAKRPRAQWHLDPYYRSIHERVYSVATCGHDTARNHDCFTLYRQVISGRARTTSEEPSVGASPTPSCRVCKLPDRTSSCQIVTRPKQKQELATTISLPTGYFCGKRFAALGRLWDILNNLDKYESNWALCYKQVESSIDKCLSALEETRTAYPRRR